MALNRRDVHVKAGFVLFTGVLGDGFGRISVRGWRLKVDWALNVFTNTRLKFGVVESRERRDCGAYLERRSTTLTSMQVGSPRS